VIGSLLFPSSMLDLVIVAIQNSLSFNRGTVETVLDLLVFTTGSANSNNKAVGFRRVERRRKSFET
jgi:hypothetical protein